VSVFLIGYRGSGKSSVGQKLAARLGWPFLDTDELIVQVAGQSIREIFEEGGEESFRQLETMAVRQVATQANYVIALGGGAVLRGENRAALDTPNNRIVYLRAEPDELHRRIHADPQTAANRPALTSLGGSVEEIRKVLAEREPIYQNMAHMEIDVTNLSPDEAVDKIAEWLK